MQPVISNFTGGWLTDNRITSLKSTVLQMFMKWDLEWTWWEVKGQGHQEVKDNMQHGRVSTMSRPSM